MKTLAFALTLSLLMSPVRADEHTQQDLSLSIYQNGLGFVRDLRKVELKQGRQSLPFHNVSPQLIPDSLLISGNGFRILERKFSFDVLSPQVLLEKSVGQDVRFRKFNPVTGRDEFVRAKILSTQGGLVIERDGQIEVGKPGDLVLEKMPAGLYRTPTLSAELEGDQTTAQNIGLAYLTNGLKWHTSYSAEIGADGTSLDVKAWANLTNTTGIDFNNTHLQLGAGSLNRESPQAVAAVMKAAPRMATMAMESALDVAPAAPQSVGGIHLYSLPMKVDLAHKETKQVALMPAQNFKSVRVLVQRFPADYGRLNARVTRPAHPHIEVEFNNTSGLPLPAGVMRLYRKDAQGLLQFVGEDQLPRTPNGAQASVKPGQSFDVTLKRLQKDFDVISQRTFEAAYEITLKNAKKVSEKVRIIQDFAGEFELKEQSHKTTARSGQSATWEVEVGPEAETVVKFAARVTRP